MNMQDRSKRKEALQKAASGVTDPKKHKPAKNNQAYQGFANEHYREVAWTYVPEALQRLRRRLQGQAGVVEVQVLKVEMGREVAGFGWQEVCPKVASANLFPHQTTPGQNML